MDWDKSQDNWRGQGFCFSDLGTRISATRGHRMIQRINISRLYKLYLWFSSLSFLFEIKDTFVTSGLYISFRWNNLDTKKTKWLTAENMKASGCDEGSQVYIDLFKVLAVRPDSGTFNSTKKYFYYLMNPRYYLSISSMSSRYLKKTILYYFKAMSYLPAGMNINISATSWQTELIPGLINASRNY